MVPWKSPVARGQMRFRCQRKNENKKSTKASHTPRVHRKTTFRHLFFFHGFVWFFFLGGWAANLRSGRLTHDQVCPALGC